MTKMQIVAKTVLVVLGINAILYLLREPVYFVADTPGWQRVLCWVLLIGLILFIARLLIFRNDSIAVRIVGAGEELSPMGGAVFLGCSYRIGLVGCGLISLSKSTRQLSALIDTFNPTAIRAWITYVINDGISFADRSGVALQTGRNLLIAGLTVYMIIGAPQFVRGQAKRVLHRNGQPEIEEYDKNE